MEAAARELQEEIGCRPGKLEPLGGEFTAPGYTTEYIHLPGDRAEASELALDDDEFLKSSRLPLAEALRQVEAGAIVDGKTIIGLLLTAVPPGALAVRTANAVLCVQYVIASLPDCWYAGIDPQ